MYVDYAGGTLPYVDTDTGEIKKAQVFVAILGWSQYAYVEAMPSQTVEDFITACENALHYLQHLEDSLGHAAAALKTPVAEVNDRIASVLEHVKTLDKELAALKGKLASAQGDELLNQARDIKGVKLLVARLDGADVAIRVARAVIA